MKSRFHCTTPQTFQEGDIVEIQVSFIVIPLRDQKCRMSVVLRSINLLDGRFTQVSMSNNDEAYWAHFFKKKQDAFVKSIMQEDTPKTKPKPTLKRRVGYSEEAVSTARAKLAAMAIDEEEVQDDLLNTAGTAN